MTDNPEQKLNNIRNRINEIDNELIKLMVERTNYAPEIVKLKLQLNKDIYDNSREELIKERIYNLCEKYNFDKKIAIEVITILMEHNKDIQKTVYNEINSNK